MQSKWSSKIKLALVLLVTIFAVYSGFAGFRVGKYIVHPFADALSWGPGFAGGYAAEYALPDGADAGAMASVVGARLKAAGVGEATVARAGDNFLRVEVPDADDAEALLTAIAATGRVEFRDPDGGVVLTRRDFKSADTQYSADVGGYLLAFELNGGGTRKFADATRRLTNQAISIYLDGELISAPTVSGEIADGMGQVPLSGGLSPTDARAQALAVELAIGGGELPFDIATTEVHAISESLGVGMAGGVSRGLDSPGSLIATAVRGFVLVLIFLIVRYRTPGAAASVVLVIEALVAMALMCEIPGARMSMWSVAGLLLGLIAALAALIAVLERVGGEVARGVDAMAARKVGFKAALPAIVDVHIAAGIVALLLLAIGAGALQGFAHALLVALGTSLAASLILLRPMLNWTADLPGNRRPRERHVPALKGARLGLIVLGAAVALALVLALAGAGISGPDLEGGTLVRYAVGEEYQLWEAPNPMRGARLAKAGASEQPEDGGDALTDLEVLLPTFDAEAVAAARASIENNLPGATLVSERAVSAAADGRLIGNLILSLLVGLVGAALYFALRFGVAAGIASLAAALYAAVAAAAVGAVFGLLFRVDTGYLAAILAASGTAVLYAAVLFGRVRENRRRPGLAKSTPAEIADTSSRELSGWLLGASAAALLSSLGMLVMDTSRSMSVSMLAAVCALACAAMPLSVKLWTWLTPRVEKRAKKAR